MTLANQNIHDILEAGLPYHVEYYNENLAFSLFPDEASQKSFGDFYVRKYQNRQPNVIIAAGQASIRLVMDYHQKFFPHVPIVFCCTSPQLYDLPKLDNDFTGTWVTYDPAKTIDAAIRLRPGTKQVFVVGGASAFDRRGEAMVKESLRDYEGKLQISYLTDLDISTLTERLKHLPDDAVVLFSFFLQDSAGRHFNGNRETVHLVTEAANVPVFVLSDGLIGYGAAGGYVVSYAQQGQVAGRMALQILRGEKPQGTAGSNAYIFDWRVLERWRIKEGALPPGSTVLNRQPTAWEFYRWYIVGGIFLCFVETSLVLGLLWQRARKRTAEQVLRESDVRSRQIVLKSPIAMVVTHGSEQKNELMNDKFTALFGYSIEDVPDVAHWWSLAYPSVEYREAVKSQWQERVAKAVKNRCDIAPMQAQVHCKDGSFRYIEFHFASLGGTDLVSFVDLTDRKQAEEQLRESQGQLAGLVASAMDAIISVDDKQHVVLFNAAAEKMFGCTADGAIGSSIDRFIPARFRAEHEAHIRRFGKAGVTSRAMGVLATLRGLRANGEEFPIEASISSVLAGGKKLFTVVIRDVTQRLLAEEKLRESEDRFRLVANKAPVLIWMSGTDKLCTFFNQGWLNFTGRSRERELGEGWVAGVHPDDLAHCLETYSAAFDARADFEMEYRLRRFDGAYRWVVDHGVPRFEPDGTFCGYIGTCVDTTDRKLSEESLHNLSGLLINAQEGERARIARELHDDFSQRLALLSIELEQLWKMLPESDTEERARIAEMLKGTKELSSDLHSLSHQLHSSKLEHMGLVAAVRGLCRELGEKYEIQMQFTENGFPVEIPRELALCLFRVAQEALGNVIKHSGAKCARVALGANADGISLRISDQGKGFDTDLTNQERGIGLRGMSERLRIVGGRLRVISELSKGTEILAEVPTATSAENTKVKSQHVGK